MKLPAGFLIGLTVFLMPGVEVGAQGGRLRANAVYELKAVPKEVEVFVQEPDSSSTKPSIAITIEQAILLALENNRSLRVEQYNRSIRSTFEEQEEAVFDPVLAWGAEYGRQKAVYRSRTADDYEDTDNQITARAGISKLFPTGTGVEVNLSGERTWSDFYSDQYASRLGFSVTQALLRGAGTEVNLAALKQAQVATQISEYEFRGFSESMVAMVEETYLDYALALRRIRIFEKSLNVAEHQLQEIEEMISVGRLAETEVTAAQAEIALQRQELIEAKGNSETTRLRLLRLLNPRSPRLWDAEIELTETPRLPEVVLDPVQDHVKIAFRLRPEINEAKLGVRSSDLEIVQTKNGLLPKMDFFIYLGKTGYADSFGTSVGNITDDHYHASAGITFQYPLRNRDAGARYRRSLLTRDQRLEAVENLEQLVELEVRTGYIEVTRAREQIFATSASRRLQEEKLRIETEKLRVGRSTAFLVSQAQRDFLSSQIKEISTVVGYLKALVALYRLEGSLLERRGITAPGREPVILIP
ncbi:MAG: TolC family protein [Deltaproteobacteria bacterium]|nr:TolC family protein [Deltaproteobacteria bacterium]